MFWQPMHWHFAYLFLNTYIYTVLSTSQTDLSKFNKYGFALSWSPFYVFFPTWAMVCYYYAFPKRQPIWLLVLLAIFYGGLISPFLASPLEHHPSLIPQALDLSRRQLLLAKTGFSTSLLTCLPLVRALTVVGNKKQKNRLHVKLQLLLSAPTHHYRQLLTHSLTHSLTSHSPTHSQYRLGGNSCDQ